MGARPDGGSYTGILLVSVFGVRRLCRDYPPFVVGGGSVASNAHRVEATPNQGRETLTRKFASLLAVAALLVTAAFGAASAVSALATTPSPPFYACLHLGALSKVSNVSHTCPTGYRAVSWSAVGPQGPPGPRRPQPELPPRRPLR